MSFTFIWNPSFWIWNNKYLPTLMQKNITVKTSIFYCDFLHCDVTKRSLNEKKIIIRIQCSWIVKHTWTRICSKINHFTFDISFVTSECIFQKNLVTYLFLMWVQYITFEYVMQLLLKSVPAHLFIFYFVWTVQITALEALIKKISKIYLLLRDAF